jgi:hypothetical protein
VAVLFMARPRHYALIRTLTLFFLLWIGFDLGAHGLLASDFPPIASRASSRLRVDDGGAAAPDAPDHCFCHGISMGAVLPTLIAGLTPAATLVLIPSPQVPRRDPHPLDRPPKLTA